MRGLFVGVIIIVVGFLAINVAVNDAEAGQCRRYAAAIRAGIDDPRMHVVGCDDNNDGKYFPTKTYCAKLQREFTRHGFHPTKVTYYLALRGFVVFEDGTCGVY